MFVDIENLKLPPKQYYNKRYETLLCDLSNPVVIDNISQNLATPSVFENYFTQDDLDWIYGYCFSNCTTVRHNDNGTMFVSGNLQGVYNHFKDRINHLLPGADKSPIVGGNYFITPSQYGLHNDSMRRSDWEKSFEEVDKTSPTRKYVPWRNLIIPIFTAPKNISSHAVFFDQRHIDWAHVYHHGMDPNYPPATTYPIIDNYANITFHTQQHIQTQQDNLKPYDQDHYEKYLYYTPYRRLTGLTPQLTCKWTPGCPIVFDAFQLHATNKGTPDTQWTIKMGLLLCFYREVE